MNEEGKNRIEDLKRKLYDKDYDSKKHERKGVLHEVKYDAPSDWVEDNLKDDMKIRKQKRKTPVFKKFFIFSLIFFLGASLFAFFRLYYNDLTVSNDKINIEVIGNSFTKGGEDLSLQIEIDNNNNASLEFANLIIEYPRGAEDNLTDVIRVPRDSIGTIKSGEKVIRNIKVKLFGAEKSVRNIKISLEYHPEGSNAIFTKEKYYPVTISMAPLSLVVDAPEQIISNQLVDLRIIVSLNTSTEEGDNPVLQVKYPSDFIFESASPVPMVDNSVWDLSKLSLTEPILINIKGRLLGQDGDERIFHVYAGSSSDTDPSKVNTVYSSLLQKMVISKPFLDAKIFVNDNKSDLDYAVSGGEDVNVTIDWANNLPTLITDGQIIASLSGNVFDRSKVKVNGGFYDSLNSQIIWDKNYLQGLAEINPGEKGSVSFSFRPISLIGLNNISSPQVSIKVSVRGRQPQMGSTYNEVDNYTERIIKLNSDFQIANGASYYSGSNPPKAETETKYKVTWILSNSSNKITQAVAKSSLPGYINFVGPIEGGVENVSYNEVTREITWKIGDVYPNTGISSNREASFILAIKPSLSQIGSLPQLTKELILSGNDSFTGKEIITTRNAINISSAGSLRVIQ